MPAQVLGIALEDNHIALVRLQGHARSYDVSLALRQRLPADDDAAQQAALRVAFVKELAAAHGLRGDTVLAALPAHRGALRNLALPFRDLRRLRQTIGFALDEHVPFEPEDVVVDFRRLPVHPAPQRTHVLAAAVPKRDVAAGLALLTEAGLEPAVLDLDVFSLADAAVLGDGGLPATNRDSSPGWGTRPPDPAARRRPGVCAQPGARRGVGPRTAAPPDAERLAGALRHTLLACEDTLQQACEPDLLLVAGGEPEAPAEHWRPALEAATGIASRAWRHQAPGVAPAGAAGEAGRPVPARRRARLRAARPAPPLSGLQPAPRRVRAAQQAARAARQARRPGGAGVRRRRPGTGKPAPAEPLQGAAPGAAAERHRRGVQRDRCRAPAWCSRWRRRRSSMRGLQRRLRAFGGLAGTQPSALQILREFSARVPAVAPRSRWTA